MERTSRRAADDSTAAEDAIRFAVEAAVWAPSVHNTQPWWFGSAGQERVSTAGWTMSRRISLHADVDRRLDVADPDGREMVISCGAALFTLRVAIRDLGHDPEVAMLPDADRPSLLADVRFGRQLPCSEENTRLYRQIRRRRTHRGAFSADPVATSLLATLRREVRHEGAELHIIADDRARAALGALTEAAEHVQRSIPAYMAEAARWAPRPGTARADGVHEHAYPRRPHRTDPHFPMRDYARGQGWGADQPDGSAEPDNDLVTGVVALLTTPDDRRTDWLRAGQALQRLLLRATADEVSAAFHTQALEVPELREFIRGRFCGGGHPQMLLRLGHGPMAPTAEGGATGVRRPVADVVTEDE
jgi:nitroreductase